MCKTRIRTVGHQVGEKAQIPLESSKVAPAEERKWITNKYRSTVSVTHHLAETRPCEAQYGGHQLLGGARYAAHVNVAT